MKIKTHGILKPFVPKQTFVRLFFVNEFGNYYVQTDSGFEDALPINKNQSFILVGEKDLVEFDIYVGETIVPDRIYAYLDENNNLEIGTFGQLKSMLETFLYHSDIIPLAKLIIAKKLKKPKDEIEKLIELSKKYFLDNGQSVSIEYDKFLE